MNWSFQGTQNLEFRIQIERLSIRMRLGLRSWITRRELKYIKIWPITKTVKIQNSKLMRTTQINLTKITQVLKMETLHWLTRNLSQQMRKKKQSCGNKAMEMRILTLTLLSWMESIKTTYQPTVSTNMVIKQTQI